MDYRVILRSQSSIGTAAVQTARLRARRYAARQRVTSTES